MPETEHRDALRSLLRVNATSVVAARLKPRTVRTRPTNLSRNVILVRYSIVSEPGRNDAESSICPNRRIRRRIIQKKGETRGREIMVAELLIHFSIFAIPDRGSAVARMRPMTSPRPHFRYFSPTGEMQEAEGNKKGGKRQNRKNEEKN